MPPAVAAFVSAHGFGHAARASAVLSALAAVAPGLRPHLFSNVPRWFFADSLRTPFVHHHLEVDVGLVQIGPFAEDAAATADRLDRWWPAAAGRLDALAATLRQARVGLVLADISPLGLLAARRAGLPAVLVENFTWDWIYRPYATACPRLGEHADTLAAVFADVDLRIQTRPLCQRLAGAVEVGPISRPPRRPAADLRRELGVPEGAPMVLVTMGGVPWPPTGLAAMAAHPRAHFVVPGAAEQTRRDGRLLALPHRAEWFHPDLVAAADLVVAKVGYSTLAEVAHAGTRLAFIARAHFPESPVLAAFARAELGAEELTQNELDSGAWVGRVDALLERPRPRPMAGDGAAEAARQVAGLLAHGA